ncbi:MAG: InlB B-repeat-containing protein, partial [Lentisphaeria bacterium]|nr:InlB B-repeat-containing protein [Lentisphaeria bacterium]
MHKYHKNSRSFFLLSALLGLIGGTTVFADDDPSADYSHLIVNFKLQDGTDVTNAYTGNFQPGKTYDPETIAVPRFPTYAGYMPSLPEAPSATGLVFEFSAADYQFTYSFDGTQAEGDIVVDIVFVPILNLYKVEYYHQSLSDVSQYDKVATETFSGMTGSDVDTDEIAARHATAAAGFSMNTFNAPTIAADGSTVVKVFYDRNYYLLSFDSNGALEAPAAVYLPYGASVGTISEPTKPGYTFAGWSPAIPSTMPAANTTCTAQWTLTTSNANVSIVVWGENANDDNYSYLATSVVSAPVDSTYTINPSTLTVYACGMQEHTHTDACLGGCTHTHTASCHGSSTTKSPSSGQITNCTDLTGGLVSGYIYRIGYTYYLYFDGTWYSSKNGNTDGSAVAQKKYSGTTYYAYKAKCSHTHTAECYSCGLTAHTHSNSCKLDTSLYNINTDNTETSVVVKADGSSVLNVYYDRKMFTITMKYNKSGSTTYGSTEYITEKWGKLIADQWNAISEHANNARWVKTTSGTSWTSLLQVMPSQDITYYMNDTSGVVSNLYYDVQSLDNPDEYEQRLQTWVKKPSTSPPTMTDDEKITIEGFTYLSGWKSGAQWANAHLKYARNSYDLILNNGKENVKTISVKFEKTLLDISEFTAYTPTRPDTVPAAYNCDGWALSPDASEAVDLTGMTMPAANLILYARWVAPEYNVLAYTTDDESSSYFEGVTIYGNKIQGLTTPTKEGHEFIGWFYTDGDGVEHAFDPDTMYVTENLHLHAKWRNLATADYTVNFCSNRELACDS